MPQAKYKQGDLVNLIDKQLLPDETVSYHPVLIISCNRSISYQNYYTGVMMSATKYTDKFSLPCEDYMFESPLPKEGCHLKLYMVFGFNESQIKDLRNRMKPIHFKGVMAQIQEHVFCID